MFLFVFHPQLGSQSRPTSTKHDAKMRYVFASTFGSADAALLLDNTGGLFFFFDCSERGANNVRLFFCGCCERGERTGNLVDMVTHCPRSLGECKSPLDSKRGTPGVNLRGWEISFQIFKWKKSFCVPYWRTDSAEDPGKWPWLLTSQQLNQLNKKGRRFFWL